MSVRIWGRIASTTVLMAALASCASPQRPHWMAFRGDMGVEIPRGDPDEVFQGNVRGEFSLLFAPDRFSPFHFGLGHGWVSFPSEKGNEEEQFNYVGSHFLLGLTLQQWIPLPLYLEGRIIERRIRPMDVQDFPVSSDDPIYDKPFPQEQGWTVEGVAGIELPMTGSTFLDMAFRISDFAPEPVEFEPEYGLPFLGSGWTFGLQLGLLWFP